MIFFFPISAGKQAPCQKGPEVQSHRPFVSFLGYIFWGRQVKMDPEKVTGRKQLQRFLGFASFYRCFTHNYSIIAAPLTRLTSVKIPFSWSPDANQAFQSLTGKSNSAPVLTRPNPDTQFILEVDAADSGFQSGSVPEISS